MILYPKSIMQLNEAIQRVNPRMLLFTGKHESNEPTLRLLYTKFGDFRLHQSLEEHGVLCIANPIGNRPVGFYNRLAIFLTKACRDLAWGDLVIDEEVDRKSHVRLGECIERFFTDLRRLKAPPWFPDNYFKYRLEGSRLVNKLFMKRVGEGKKLYDLLFKLLDEYPVPLSDYGVAARLSQKYHDMVFLFLHGDYAIREDHIRPSDRMAIAVLGQNVFKVTPLYSDQIDEDQKNLTKSESITKTQARAAWIELSYESLRTVELKATEPKIAAILYNEVVGNPLHGEERKASGPKKQGSQLAMRYMFEGNMRREDFETLRERHAYKVLSLIEHISSRLALAPKYSIPAGLEEAEIDFVPAGTLQKFPVPSEIKSKNEPEPASPLPGKIRKTDIHQEPPRQKAKEMPLVDENEALPPGVNRNLPPNVLEALRRAEAQKSGYALHDSLENAGD
ncbi:MAG: hypothetical protein M1269_05265 [Chloroflexi bacterium]|nr:hypothetical protein [Chloroflexota bacterium]